MEINLNVVFLILAILSIIISISSAKRAESHKESADRANKEASDALQEIRAEVKVIKEYAIPELKAYGESVREFMFKVNLKESLGHPVIKNETSDDIIHIHKQGNLRQDILETIEPLAK